MDWTEETIERFSRQVVMREVGVKGQGALCAARFALEPGEPWDTMTDLLVRAGLQKSSSEGFWLNTGEQALFLTAHPWPQSNGLVFTLAEQPMFCHQTIPVYPLLRDPTLAPALATWWCGVVLGLPRVGLELHFSPERVWTEKGG